MTLWPKSTISVEEAISLVTSNIALIRNAESKDEVLSYEPEKVAKNKVDRNSNQPMLGQLANFYREHAEILKDKGCDELTRKSWKRADEILSPHGKQGAKSIMKAGNIFASVVPKTRMCLPFVRSSSSTTANLSEDKLNQEERKWLLATRSNKDEMRRLKKIADDVVRAFIKADIKDSDIITEIMPLAFNLERDLHRRLLNSFIDVINQSALLDIESLDGLAQIIQSAGPGFINSGDLVSILQVLSNRLQKVQSEAVDHRYRLMFTISRVLDAMVAANVGDIDRVNLYDPLASLLDMSKSNIDPYLSFQVEYAAQALLNVSNDEKPWHAGFRRLWLAVLIGASFVKVPDPKEIKMVLEGLEKLYSEGRRDFITLKETINGKGRVEFNFKDGLQFKLIWYRALRTAELYIQIGKLTYFEEFVTNARCRDNRMFQLGVCQLLGEFMVDTRWELVARQNAFAFIRAICHNETIWVLHDDAKMVIYDILFNLDCNYGTDFEDPSELSILQVSDEPLPLETCFVNLAIVEVSKQREQEKEELQQNAAIYHRIPSSEFVQGTNLQSSITLEQLFDRRKLCNGKKAVPKRILVQGRAGIGKTTLCKKLVHSHQNGLFRDRFDIILWLPLRELKVFRQHNLKSLLCKKYFMKSDLNHKGTDLAEEFMNYVRNGKALFILDGLDEIITDLASEYNIDLKEFVIDLLQQYVIITSRPSGVDRSLLPPIDLELETIGFHQQNVNDYLVNVLEPKTVVQVQEFFRHTPLIQGLISIPVQLDVICFCWDDLIQDDTPISMTRLYQQMVLNLWRKDAVRLNKKAGGELLTANNLKHTRYSKINDLMAIEVLHLGYLAFKGMTNSHQIQFTQKELCSAFDDLEVLRKELKNDRWSPQLVDDMKKTSFLHSPDTDIDSEHQSWNFLHLTFQEYFAATWIARQIQHDNPYLSAGEMKEERTIDFVHRYKYDPRYEIVFGGW
ncbi:hypothetical protein FBU30_004701 [Linnemannia zychae]|nr:hypothetical protein FBU30_004701 [Linnemannia zychae]